MRIPIFITLTVLIPTVFFGQNPFPLSSGNLWQFEEADPMYEWRETIRVGDTATLPNGKLYYLVSGYPDEVAQLRTEGLKVFAYWSNDTSEHTLYDFSATVGDTISFGDPPNQRIFLSSIDSVLLFGSMRKRWLFGLDHAYWVSYHSIVEGIGLIEFTGEVALDFLLLGAMIEGVQYGTIVSVPENQNIPRISSLVQNYPNPFNPSTTIIFTLQKPTRVSISIHNVSGEIIATLIDAQQMPSGTHEVDWTPKGIATGVYFCRLIIEGAVLNQRLVYIR